MQYSEFMADEMRVLYVDDEPELLTLAKIFLEKTGEFQVGTSTSAREALASPSIRSYDIIISDYQMPDMDGIAFLKEVREQFGDLPFILFTGRGREEIVIEAINHGVDFYLQKGGDAKAQFAELAHKIRQAVARQRAQVELRNAYDQITASKEELARSEQQIRENETKFRDLADRLPQMVFETDLDLRITYVNQHAVTVYGFPAEKLDAGINVLSLIHPSQHATFMDSVHKIVDGIPFEPKEYTVFKKDGGTLTVVVYSSPIFRNKTLVGFRGIAVDISDRKRAEEALRESEEKYRLLVEVNQDIIYSLDPDGTIRYVGPQAYDQIGFWPDEMEGHNFTEFIHPDDIEKLVSGFKENSPERSDILSDQFRVRRKDGTYRWYEDKTINAVDHQGRGVAIGTIRDITDNKRIQEERTESERMFQTLVELSLDGIMIADFSGNVLFINQTAARIVDVTDPEAIIEKRNVAEFVAPEFQRELNRDFHRVLQGIDSYLVQYKLITETKREVWVEFIGKKIRFDNTDAMLVSMRDVTERNSVETALRESEAHYRLLADNVHDVIWTADMDKRLTYISPSVKELLGMTPEEALAMPIDEVMTPESLQVLNKHHQDGQDFRENRHAIPESRSMDLEFRRKDGSTVWTEVVITPTFDSDGILNGVVGVSRDITKRRMAKEALRQANKKLTILASITRHDIRNKLMMLDGFIELLRTKIPDPSCNDYFSRITTISSQILNLIQFTGEYEKIGVHAPVWQDIRSLADSAGKDAVQGQTTLINDLPAGLEIFADPLISKVFFNLVDNALRHGGKLTTIRFFMEEQNGCRIIVCTDDGAGIPEGEKEKIFALGFGKNTGFGLAISREILDITGITIKETGTQGNGARFEILVPKEQYRSLAKHPATQE